MIIQIRMTAYPSFRGLSDIRTFCETSYGLKAVLHNVAVTYEIVIFLMPGLVSKTSPHYLGV